MAEDRIAWHPALLPALQLTFEQYLDALDIQHEQPLNTEPLRIDALIIKKIRDMVIDNPITRIWRRVNVFEYKSPSVSFSVEEFYKGIVYVFLYASLHKTDITDMSLSVLVTKRSLSVRRYIQNIWKDTVTEQEKGIYCVGGLPFPVQIIETPELSRERNLFLRSLNTGLDEETMAWAIQVGAGDHKMDVSAYVDVIIRANKELLEEMMMLKSSALEEIIEKSGLAARLEERGRREGEERGRREGEERGRREGEDRRSIEIAKNMIRKGWDSADIAEITGLDLDTVQSLRLPSEDKKP